MSTANPDKDFALLLELKYGDPANFQFARYTSWSKAQSLAGAIYQSATKMEVSIPENSGKLDEQPLEVELPLTGFLDVLSNGEPHSPVFATLYEMTLLSTGTPTVVTRFVGKLTKSIRNPPGKPGMVSLEITSWKGWLDIAVSLTSDHECENTLGDAGCKIDLPPLKKPGVIATITGTVATITGLPAASGFSWRRGYIEYLGLRIGVREFFLPSSFLLVKQPPDSWLGSTVTVVPGCDLSKATCQLYANESNFNGVGIKTPNYNPVIEAP